MGEGSCPPVEAQSRSQFRLAKAEPTSAPWEGLARAFDGELEGQLRSLDVALHEFWSGSVSLVYKVYFPLYVKSVKKKN